MPIGERIRQLRLEKEWNQRTFAERLGISQGRLSNWERNTRKPRMDELERLAHELRTSADFLMHGNRGYGKRNLEQTNVSADLPIGKAVPVVQWEQLKKLKHPIESSESETTETKVSNKAFALRVLGDSMAPMFPDGSTVFLSLPAKPRAAITSLPTLATRRKQPSSNT